MEPNIKGFAISLIFIAIALLSNKIGDLLTRKTDPLLNFRPFNCRPCLTFWLTFLLGSLISIIATSEDFARLALIAQSAVVGLINYVVTKSKFKIYE